MIHNYTYDWIGCISGHADIKQKNENENVCIKTSHVKPMIHTHTDMTYLSYFAVINDIYWK